MSQEPALTPDLSRPDEYTPTIYPTPTEAGYDYRTQVSQLIKPEENGTHLTDNDPYTSQVSPGYTQSTFLNTHSSMSRNAVLGDDMNFDNYQANSGISPLPSRTNDTGDSNSNWHLESSVRNTENEGEFLSSHTTTDTGSTPKSQRTRKPSKSGSKRRLVSDEPAQADSGDPSEYSADMIDSQSRLTVPENSQHQATELNSVEECVQCTRSGAECEPKVFERDGSFYHTKRGTCPKNKKCSLTRDWKNLRKYRGDKTLIEDPDQSEDKHKARRVHRSHEAKEQARTQPREAAKILS